MTLEQFALISIGHISLACTFVLGVLVGCSLSKKRTSHGRYEGTKADWWHHIERRRAEECARGCKPGCANKGTKAGADERASG
jgi:hypothetical protein